MSDTPPIRCDYQIEGGALQIDAPTYVKRQADDVLYNALLAGKFCYALNARQMGKSSLRVRMMQRLEEDGIICSAVDLQGIGTSLTEEQWYFSILNRITRGLRIRRQFDLDTWWTTHHRSSYVQRFSLFLETVLLPTISQPIVIFIDEVDLTLMLPFKIDDFFGALRECYNRRADESEFCRLTFALLGVATPADLIQNKQITPFNIGQPIELTGFSLEEVQPLLPGLLAKSSKPQALLQAVLDWTGGQPFLTQKVCKLISCAESDPVEGQEAHWVEQVVKAKIIENWEAQDIPQHLITIRDRLVESDERQKGRLLGLYQQIMQEKEIAADDSPEQMTLRLTGLVIKRDGKLRVYNRIYEQVFNHDWLERELAKLRPYGAMISAWLKSGQKDESRLLRGDALQDALEWSEGKRLGDEDYRFLNASQEVEKRVVEEENCILEGARQKAETKTRKANRRLMWSSIVAVALIVAAFFGLRDATSARDAAFAQQEAAEVARDQANISRDQAIKDAKAARLDRNKANQDRDKAQLDRDKANQDKDKARQDAQLANQQKINAQKLAAQAQADQQKAQAKAREALENRDQALQDLDTLFEGIVYERNAGKLIQQYQFATLDGLVEIMKSGQWLRSKVRGNRPLEKYPGYNTIIALRTIIGSGTHLRNQLELRQPPERILSVSYSPDQHHLATGSNTGTVRFWTTSGQPLNYWSTGSAQLLGISFSPNQRHLATASSDGKVKLWDLQGKSIREWQAHTEAVKSVSYSPDGQLLATGGQDGLVKIWNLSGKKQREWQAHAVTVVADGVETKFFQYDVVPLGVTVRFNPSNRNQLVTATLGEPVKLWSISGQFQREVPIPVNPDNPVVVPAYGINFSPDGKRLAISGRILNLSGNGQMIAYNPNLRKYSYDNNFAADVSFSPDGKRLITTNNIRASIWDLEETSGSADIERSWKAYPEFDPYRSQPRGWRVFISPDNQHIAAWSDMGFARVWDLSGRELAKFTNVSSINFDQQTGKFLAIGYQNGHVEIRDSSGQHQQIPQWSAHSTQGIGSVSFSPNGQQLLTSGNDQMVRIWNIFNPSTPRLSTEWSANCYFATFSPDGQHIAAIKSGLATGLVLWNLAGQPMAEWRTHNVTRSLMFNSDGTRIATAGDDYVATVRVWDLSGKEVLRISPNDNLNARVEQVSISPDKDKDKQLLATAGLDGTVQLWTLSGLKIAQFAPYGVNAGPWIRSVSFSPDGKFLAIADDPYGEVRLWRVEGLDNLIKQGELDSLLNRGCAWLKDYVASHPKEASEICPNQS